MAHYRKAMPFQDMKDPPHHIFENSGPLGCLLIHSGDYLLQCIRHLHLYFNTFLITLLSLMLASLLILLYKINKLASTFDIVYVLILLWVTHK